MAIDRLPPEIAPCSMSQLSCQLLYNKEMTGQLGASKSLNLRGLMIDGVHWRPIPKKLRGTTGKSLPFKETQFLQRHSAVPMSRTCHHVRGNRSGVDPPIVGEG